MSAPTRHGHVKFYNSDKGYGFLIADDGSGDVFFHVSQVVAMAEPQKGQRVVFRMGQHRGRPVAQHVAHARPLRRRSCPPRDSAAPRDWPRSGGAFLWPLRAARGFGVKALSASIGKNGALRLSFRRRAHRNPPRLTTLEMGSYYTVGTALEAASRFPN